MLNADTGYICELEFEGWALKAAWSRNGRYLAIARTQGSFPISFSDLRILDSRTGHMYTMEVTARVDTWGHYVDDLAWAPDSHHLLAIAKEALSAGPAGSAKDYQSGLYLIDFVAGESIRVLPGVEFDANTFQGNLAWSPDGSQMLVRCPTMLQDRVCLVPVKMTEP